MDTPEVTTIIFQELLDHFWKVQDTSAPHDLQLFPEGCLITYATLCTKANMRELTHQIGEPLYLIASYCHSEGWPPLTALVVHHETRYPGSDYFQTPGCSNTAEGWTKDVADVLGFRGYPHEAPNVEALAERDR